MKYIVSRMVRDATPLLVVHRRATRPDLATIVPEACGVVWDFVRRSGVASAGRHVAVYRNATIDLEVGAEVGADAVGGGDVVRSATPAGPVATTAHFGDYARLHEAHAAILRWCADHRHRLAGPSWEVYGHMGDGPEAPRTDVYYLLAGEVHDTPAR